MDTAQINLYLDKAFEYWLKLTGLTGAERVWHLGGPNSNWHLKDQTTDIQDSRRRDPTGLTSFMLMKAFVKEYLSAETFSAWDLLQGLSEEQSARVDLLREVHSFLQQPVIEGYVDDFIDDLRQTIAKYGIDHEDLESWFTNPYWMALLRRDALKSFELLEAHQFCYGEPGTGKPSYGTEVLEFWNMPSLIRAMSARGKTGGRGINLCLIRDPVAVMSSFFVLAIVNGESLTVLTDRDKAPHPDYKKCTRRPGRSLDRRASQHWFPYDLLDLELSSDGKDLYAKARTGLVPVNAQAVKLSSFDKLFPSNAIWLTLLFDLLKEKYLTNNHKHKQLSYTVEMIRAPHLLAGAESALVKKGLYEPLVLDPVTHEHMETDTLSEKQQWAHKLHKEFQWMLDRYGPQVPEGVFNLVGVQERTRLASSEVRLALPGKQGDELVQGYAVMDPIAFGTAEHLERDRDWTARKNLCIAVQHLADQEFRETYESIMRFPHKVWDSEPSGWYIDQVRAREELLIEKAAVGEWWYDEPARYNSFGRGEDAPEGATERVNLVRVAVHDSWPGLGRIGFPRIHLSEVEVKGYARFCPITGAKATFHAVITPRDGHSLAMLLGIPFEELPWQLQVWQYKPWDVYKGNSILSRCDPAEHLLYNPWTGHKTRSGRGHNMPLEIGISLSRRAVNKIRKEKGLPRMDWKALEEEDRRHRQKDSHKY